MAPGELIVPYLPRRHLYIQGIPVLLYHGLTVSASPETPPQERKYWVSAADFRGHLSQILRSSHQIMSLRQAWTGARPLHHGKTPAVLTFDDGRESDYHVAFPLLQETNMQADFFVNTATIGREGFLEWGQIIEMHRHGMSFNSHSHHHVNLTRRSPRLLQWDLSESKRRLEDRLGSSVDFLAVPFGLLNRRVLDVALQEGYRAVCTSWGWPARPGARTVNRVAIYAHTTRTSFAGLLAGDPASYAFRAVRAMLLHLPKRLLARKPSRHGLDTLEARP